MKTVTLSCGREATVSDIDYERVRQYRWWAHTHNASGQPYARARTPNGDVYMHRFIVGGIIALPPSMKVDHLNNDTLFNTRDNLRVASHYENNTNRRFWTATGFKGVTKVGARFRARITIDHVETVLGRFDSAEEAARAYDAAAFAQWGEFAYLNFRTAFPIPPADNPEAPF